MCRSQTHLGLRSLLLGLVLGTVQGWNAAMFGAICFGFHQPGLVP
jgi:hypothetical protein